MPSRISALHRYINRVRMFCAGLPAMAPGPAPGTGTGITPPLLRSAPCGLGTRHTRTHGHNIQVPGAWYRRLADPAPAPAAVALFLDDGSLHAAPSHLLSRLNSDRKGSQLQLYLVPRSGLEQNLFHLEHFCSRVQAPAPRSHSTRRVPCFQLGKHCLDPKFHEESESGLRSRQSPLLACENVSCCLAPGCQLAIGDFPHEDMRKKPVSAAPVDKNPEPDFAGSPGWSGQV
jgi:hypothetical protein